MELRESRRTRAHDVLVAVVFLCIALVVHASSAWLHDGFLRTGRLADADSWARSLRVLALWEGQAAWFEDVLPALNAPTGLSLHWTRPLDLLILAAAVPLRHGFGWARPDAVLFAGAVICPLLHWLAALAAIRATRPIWPQPAPFLAGLMLLLHPAALGYAAFGRADHHILVLLFGMLALADAIRAVPGTSPDRHAAWRCGGWLGAAIWVSPEGLLFAAPILGAFGLAWVLDGARDRRGRDTAGQGMRASLGLGAVCLLAVLVEHPATGWLGAEYDKVSIQHVAIGLLAATVFGLSRVLARRAASLGRALVGAALSVSALALLLWLRPDALSASAAGADPEAVALFLPHVQEMRPLDPSAPADWVVIGPVPLALLALGVGWRRWRRMDQLGPVLVLAMTALVCGIATLRHLRFALDLAAPTVVLTAVLPAAILQARLAALPRLSATLLSLALILGWPAAVTLAAGPSSASASRQAPGADCGMDRLPATLAAHAAASEIAAGPAAPVIMANDMNVGPELAWATPYRLVASPYHRAGAAFRDMFEVFGATDDGVAHQILARRQASLLLVCPNTVDPSWPSESLERRLQGGVAPSWLVAVPLPDLPPGVSLFRVVACMRQAAAGGKSHGNSSGDCP